MQKPYDLINWFWRKQRAYSLHSDCISLFFFLFQHCNDAEWEVNPFELRIDKIRTDLGITEERVHSARQALEKAGVLESRAQFGRGKAYIFYLTCLPVQSEELYKLMTAPLEKGTENPDEKGNEKAAQKGMQKGSVKGELKGSVKDPPKEELKGAKKDPFYTDFSPLLLDRVLDPLLDTLSTAETASNGQSASTQHSTETTTILPLKTGGEEEEEDDEDITNLLPARVREDVQTAMPEEPKPPTRKRQPSKPVALADVLAYAEQQRTLAGKAMATPLLAEKFWNYYEDSAWHIVPKGGGDPSPITDWRKKFLEWEMSEREEASKRPPPYSLNVNDIPHELRSISNFNDVWSDYLNQCATHGSPHDRTSALYAMQNLVSRQTNGEKVLEILTNAIRSQRKDFWSNQHGSKIAGRNSQTVSAAGGRNQGRRKPQPGTNTDASTTEAVTFS